jgi:hypothetical protein
METIRAERGEGSRQDGLRHAAAVGAAQRGISADDAVAYIRRRSPARWESG